MRRCSKPIGERKPRSLQRATRSRRVYLRNRWSAGSADRRARYDESQRKCGVYAVDFESGQVAGFLVFEAGCTEIFDIQVLPGLRWPAIVGFQDKTLDGILIAPPAVWQPGAVLR